jgi:clan AA aspartic protease (TIGR02281 family)
MRLILSIGLTLGLLLSGAAGAEFYRWVDAQGQLHFTEDLNQVPARHRAEAEASTRRAPRGNPVQRIQIPQAPAQRVPVAGSSRAGEVFTVPVERAGLSMRVLATLNGEVQAPFIIDTGASDVVIPAWVADRLGIQITESNRTQLYQTANGVVEAPVVRLGSIDLGGAVAHDISASVSDSMRVGLLGLSYFNRFTYHVDPGRGVVTLRPNGLTEEGVIRGGRSESEWRSEFHQLRGRRALVEARKGRLTPAHSRLLRDLDSEIANLELQIEELEIEADRARVPHGWRE